MAVFKLSRRRLLFSAAGATVVAGGAGLWLGIDHFVADRRYRKAVQREGYAFAPSVYLAITPDDWVTIWLTKSEMGQGVSTSLPMIVCEELDADWERVRVEQAVAGDGFDYGSMFTAASSSVSSMWHELRMAGATARAMLVAAAAERWGVSASECRVAKGAIEFGPNRLRFGELAGAASKRRAPLRQKLKAEGQFSLVGTSPTRLDAEAVVTGQAVFGLDVRERASAHRTVTSRQGVGRHGNKHPVAVLLRPPRAGAELLSYDATAARSVPGVLDIVDTSAGTAIIASNTYAAIKGRSAIEARWGEQGALRLNTSSVQEQLARTLRDGTLLRVAVKGEAAEAIAGAPTLSAEYALPYMAHACMEPMNATVTLRENSCHLSLGTQVPQQARDLAAAMTGLSPDQVHVDVARLGGGFGRRASLDYVEEAIAVSQRVGGTVQLVWTREDDLTLGQYRPASRHQLTATITTNDPSSLAVLHRFVTAGEQDWDANAIKAGLLIGAVDHPYDFSSHEVRWASAKIPVSTRIWRSVGHVHNCFALECFLDELSAKMALDPLEMRLALLRGQPRMSNCLSKVAELSDWSKPQPAHRSLGLAASHCMGSYVAQVVETEQLDRGGFRIVKVWSVVDCGIGIHPDTIVAQIQGGLIDGLSAALYGEIDWQDGAVTNGNFDSYRVIRINEAPEVEVEVVKSQERPTGVGEVGLPAAAPALANSLAGLSFGRIRTLPIKTLSHRLG